MKNEIIKFRETATGVSTSHRMTKYEFDSIQNWLFDTFEQFEIFWNKSGRLENKSETITVRIPL